tara:strand:- start:5038 stop:6312 length:1275 start_codon:yes stop_codon:yes gene_type:complete
MKEIQITEWDNLSKKEKSNVTKITFPGTKNIKDIKHRPTMAFAVMCKDEEEHIGTSLNAVKDYVDYVVVADNGSTDDTFNIVRKYFEDTGIPGAWHIDKWEGFGKTKTKMMAHVKDKTDYVIHLDADDFLEGNFKFDFNDSGKDQYLILNKKGGSAYWCSVIYDNRLTWVFAGIAHTVIRAEERLDYLETENLSGERFWINNTGLGSRILDPKKFLKDARALENQYWETLIDDPYTLNSRSVFYCAQSYKDHGSGIEKKYLITSLRWYNKYLTLRNTWYEEEYEALISIAGLKAQINGLQELDLNFSWQNIESDLLNAIETVKDRAEAYYRLGTLYNNNQQFKKGYEILRKGKKISLENAQARYKLFIMKYQYEDWFNDQLSVSCFYLGKKEEGIKLIKDVIDNPDHADSIPHYQSNLDHFNNL